MRTTSRAELTLVVLGWVTIAFWLSNAVFPMLLPPLAAWPDLGPVLHGIAPWTRAQVPGMDKPDHEVVAALDRQLLAIYAVRWLTMAAGVVSGALLILRPKTGRLLALLLCGCFLTLFMVDQVRKAVESMDHLAAFWIVTTRVAPAITIRRVADLAFYATSIALLLHGRMRATVLARASRPSHQS